MFRDFCFVIFFVYVVVICWIRLNLWFVDEKCEVNLYDKFRVKNIFNGCLIGKFMYWVVLVDVIFFKKEKKKIKILIVIICWKEDDFKYYIF